MRQTAGRVGEGAGRQCRWRTRCDHFLSPGRPCRFLIHTCPSALEGHRTKKEFLLNWVLYALAASAWRQIKAALGGVTALGLWGDGGVLSIKVDVGSAGEAFQLGQLLRGASFALTFGCDIPGSPDAVAPSFARQPSPALSLPGRHCFYERQ